MLGWDAPGRLLGLTVGEEAPGDEFRVELFAATNSAGQIPGCLIRRAVTARILQFKPHPASRARRWGSGAVPIAADESIRRADDPLRVAVAGAADIAVIKCTPLGGVHRSLRVAEAAGLPCVVSSALETSVGLATQLALAGALPELDFACGLGTLSLL
jgi:hypothetical protein